MLSQEQNAVIAACKKRYRGVESVAIETTVIARVVVADTDGHPTELLVAEDGTTRTHHGAYVPVRLYGQLPNDTRRRETWGKGLPKHAERYLHVKEEHSGD